VAPGQHQVRGRHTSQPCRRRWPPAAQPSSSLLPVGPQLPRAVQALLFEELAAQVAKVEEEGAAAAAAAVAAAAKEAGEAMQLEGRPPAEDPRDAPAAEAKEAAHEKAAGSKPRRPVARDRAEAQTWPHHRSPRAARGTRPLREQRIELAKNPCLKTGVHYAPQAGESLRSGAAGQPAQPTHAREPSRGAGRCRVGQSRGGARARAA